MDRKSVIILIACFLLLFSWPLLVNKVYPPKPLPSGSTNAPTPSLSTNNISNAQPPVTPEATSVPKSTLNTSVPEQLRELTNADAHYTFSSYVGGLKLVELLKYPESIATRRDERSHTNRVATLNSYSPNPTLAVLDGEAVQGDGVFSL